MGRMNDDYLEQLAGPLKKALETMERQANDMSLPASARRYSARQLVRYKAIIRKYPALLEEDKQWHEKK
jgi:hypothetical protein